MRTKKMLIIVFAVLMVAALVAPLLAGFAGYGY